VRVFLTNVRDRAFEDFDNIQRGYDRSDVAHTIAMGAPDAYTTTRWAEFVDLAAYQEELEDGNWPTNLTDAAELALTQIAERLVYAVWDAMQEIIDATDTTEGN
jgi:hypothetical protein